MGTVEIKLILVKDSHGGGSYRRGYQEV